jgi:PKD repeat protein
MVNRFTALSALAAVVATIAACTVHQSDPAPPLAGPSDFAQSVIVSASPDRLPQDGEAQSSITIRVFNAAGSPAVGVAVQVDVLGDGSLVNPGSLSAQRLVTQSDGRATAVYTVPPATPPTVCDVTTTVTILATAIGSNAQTANPFSADIRLVPAGTTLPPVDASAPIARFTFSPTNATINQVVTFDASASSASSGRVLGSYIWDFADGTIKQGPAVTHDFATRGCRKVTLTVADNTGQRATTKQPVTIF